MRIAAVLLACCFSTVWLAGCAAQSPAVSDGHQHSECTVCVHNADLACVDVDVDKDTPHTDYQGKTYYFCSDGCRKAFAKDPAKYAKP